MNIGLISSRGGHLQQLLRLRDAYATADPFLITTPAPAVLHTVPGFRVCYCVTDIDEGRWRSPANFLAAMWQYQLIFRRERPGLVISTGAGIAVPGFLLARLYGAKSIFLEAGARVTTLSKAGKLCYHFADLFLVQHRGLLQAYPRARYHGILYQHLGE